MQVLVTKETQSGETRVAVTPETLRGLLQLGCTVAIEQGAGEASFYSDGAYAQAGATIAPDASAAYSHADVVLAVRRPKLERMKEGALAIGLLDPHAGAEVWDALKDRSLSAVALELLPRISRAQSMDALSSQASITGYRAALLAAQELPRYFPLLMTAAGTIRGAKVVVLGAGVAGLQAIATARRLGAVVESTDVRSAVREEVESVGARFIEPPTAPQPAESDGGYARDLGAEFALRQREVLADPIARADAVICAAMIPGKPAPMLVSTAMVETMRPGSVIIDLAAESGGNCELTRADKRVQHGGVSILGPTNLPATMPADASTLYAKNILALLKELIADGELKLDADNEIVRGALMARDGAIQNHPVARGFGLVDEAELRHSNASRKAG